MYHFSPKEVNFRVYYFEFSTLAVHKLDDLGDLMVYYVLIVLLSAVAADAAGFASVAAALAVGTLRLLPDGVERNRLAVLVRKVLDLRLVLVGDLALLRLRPALELVSGALEGVGTPRVWLLFTAAASINNPKWVNADD